MEDMIRLSVEFVKVSKDFLIASKNVGKVIISEAFIPDEKKTIKPINIGGVIGGEKYIVHSILFKFAVSDVLDDVAAAKVAGHDLKSAALWFHQTFQIPELHVPMQCIIDYLGFRLLAMTLLPIGKKQQTLKVGTENAGVSFHNEDKVLLDLMNKAAQRMNLALHDFKGNQIRAAVDIEGHLGTDGKYYIIDLSRTCPPALPPSLNLANAPPNFHLYQLLRPEFVVRYKDPLCSDCISRFMAPSEETARLNTHLLQACTYLYKTVIPEFVPELDKRIDVAIRRNVCVPGNYKFSVARAFHEKGINLRYLGLVHDLTESPISKSLLLIEMMARTIKRKLRSRMRQKMKALHFPLETPYIHETVGFLNDCIFRTNDAMVWRRHLEPGVDECFSWQPPPSSNLREMVWNCPIPDPNKKDKMIDGYRLLLERVYCMLGLIVQPLFLPQMVTICEPNLPPETIRPMNTYLTVFSVLEMGERIKTLPNVKHSQGYVVKHLETLKACPSFSPQDKASLAVENFEAALEGMPTNPVTLRNCAESGWKLLLARNGVAVHRDKYGETLPAEDREKVLLNGADDISYIHQLFQSSIDFGPDDTHTHFLYGQFAVIIGDLKVAEDQFLLSLKANNAHFEACAALEELYTTHHVDQGLQDLVSDIKAVKGKMGMNRGRLDTSCLW